MAAQINLNADMGEGFGAYDIGDDAGLLKIIRSASIACGFHAGDPVTMQRMVTEAVAAGVSIGAHPGFNDLWGFGRRRIDMNPRELEYMIAYQIGALQAMACYAGAKVTHLKPHGSLNNMAAENLELALAIGRGIREGGRAHIFYGAAGGVGGGGGGPRTRAAGGARGLLRPALRRRRQPDLAEGSGCGAPRPRCGPRARRQHGRERRDRLAQRQAAEAAPRYIVRPRRRAERRHRRPRRAAGYRGGRGARRYPPRNDPFLSPSPASLSREIPAIDPEFGAGDVGGLVRSEEQHGVGDLLDAAGAAHRYLPQHPGADVRVCGAL